MREHCVDLIIQGLKEASVSVVCALPDSHLKEVYVRASKDPDFEYVPVTNEGEGASIAGGVWLTGKKAALIMENSGLRMACEALAHLGFGHGIPVLLLMSYRGQMGEANWWGIGHRITMEPLLDTLRIPYSIVRKEEEIVEAIVNAQITADTSKHHAAVVFAGGLLK